MLHLTLRQPWAQLLARGDKTVETRGYQTAQRGLVAIHAGKHRPEHGSTIGDWFITNDGDGISRMCQAPLYDLGRWTDLPLGMIVAVGRLAEVVPIVWADTYLGNFEWEPNGEEWPDAAIVVDEDPKPLAVDEIHYWSRQAFQTTDSEEIQVGWQRRWTRDERPFGDYQADRYAWIFEDIVELTNPVPNRGAQGLRTLDPAIEAQVLTQLPKAA